MMSLENGEVWCTLTGRRPVRPAADNDFKFSPNAKATRTLTGQSPVRPAGDDDFEI